MMESPAGLADEVREKGTVTIPLLKLRDIFTRNIAPFSLWRERVTRWAEEQGITLTHTREHGVPHVTLQGHPQEAHALVVAAKEIERGVNTHDAERILDELEAQATRDELIEEAVRDNILGDEPRFDEEDVDAMLDAVVTDFASKHGIEVIKVNSIEAAAAAIAGQIEEGFAAIGEGNEGEAVAEFTRDDLVNRAKLEGAILEDVATGKEARCPTEAVRVVFGSIAQAQAWARRHHLAYYETGVREERASHFVRMGPPASVDDAWKVRWALMADQIATLWPITPAERDDPVGLVTRLVKTIDQMSGRLSGMRVEKAALEGKLAEATGDLTAYTRAYEEVSRAVKRVFPELPEPGEFDAVGAVLRLVDKYFTAEATIEATQNGYRAEADKVLAQVFQVWPQNSAFVDMPQAVGVVVDRLKELLDREEKRERGELTSVE